MGCYRLYPSPGGSINKEGAVNLCVSDGASLVLINSEAEHQAFNGALGDQGITSAFIQGKRTNVGSPWTDESGNPLSYLAPEMVNNGASGSNMLLLIYKPTAPLRYQALEVPVSYPTGVLC
ncbi:uncharacterized protein LOC144627529 [Crassostrea virginica]